MSLQHVLGVVFGLLFMGLLVAGEGNLAWPQYARMAAVVACLAGWAAAREFTEAGSTPLVAAVLLAGGAQLSPAAAGWVSALLWAGLAGVAVAGAAICGQLPEPGRGALSRLEWTVLTAALSLMLVSVGTGALPGLEPRWSSALQWVLYPIAWLGMARWLVGKAPLVKGAVLGPAVAVLAVVCTVGGAKMAMALYEVSSARTAVDAEQYDAAEVRYRRVGEIGASLGLMSLQDEALLGLSTSLAGQGDMDSARAVLGISEDLVVTIQPDQWEGQTGGFLFKETNCWTDLGLLKGTVEVEVSARGRKAQGEWPRLLIELGGQQLGSMEVSSRTRATVRTFTTRVPAGRHRMVVSLVKGFWSSRGEHRWARLGTVKVRYLEAVQ